VERGNASWRIYRTIGLIISAALVPFALSLGFDTFIFMERLAAARSAALAAAAIAGIALWFWFGAELFVIMSEGSKPMRMTEQVVALDKKIDQMLTEARVILPGVQALLGIHLGLPIGGRHYGRKGAVVIQGGARNRLWAGPVDGARRLPPHGLRRRSLRMLS